MYLIKVYDNDGNKTEVEFNNIQDAEIYFDLHSETSSCELSYNDNLLRAS